MKKANKNAVSASGSRTIINKSGAKEPCGATKSRQIRSEPLRTPFFVAKNPELGSKFRRCEAGLTPLPVARIDFLSGRGQASTALTGWASTKRTFDRLVSRTGKEPSPMAGQFTAPRGRTALNVLNPGAKAGMLGLWSGSIRLSHRYHP